jgi:hypothetical protein
MDKRANFQKQVYYTVSLIAVPVKKILDVLLIGMQNMCEELVLIPVQ